MKRQSLLILLIWAGLLSCSSRREAVSGVVLDESGAPLAATVRIQGTDITTVSGEDGSFSLPVAGAGDEVFITAWAPGYFINGIERTARGATPIEIVLQAHHTDDNPNYAWRSSIQQSGQGEDQGCAECHSRVDSSGQLRHPQSLPVDQWLQDGHAYTTQNPRFLTMYTGSDLWGNQSQPTRKTYSRDYGGFPLPPDPSQPYYGPGYKLDFPGTAGNCGACHAPAAAGDNPYGIDPTTIEGVAAEGIPCDFCHKIREVRLDADSGMPYENMPGVLSYGFLRPPEGHQFFAGPFDDVAPGEDTFSPLQQQSEFCAPCHYAVFWDTVIYNSYGEWLDSPYSDPETGQTCQDCHMPPLGVSHFALPSAGGIARDPETIAGHRMPGASDVDLLQEAVTMEVTAVRDEHEIVVTVTLINDKTGHDVPTDSPLRHLILLVRATDASGIPLSQVSGATIPSWAGVGAPEDGYYGDLPGKGYAKILMELWTEITPSGGYWNPTRVVSDNRLAPFSSDKSTYVFSAQDELVDIEVTLLYRRAFKDLMDQKGWVTPDIVMEQAHRSVP